MKDLYKIEFDESKVLNYLDNLKDIFLPFNNTGPGNKYNYLDTNIVRSLYKSAYPESDFFMIHERPRAEGFKGLFPIQILFLVLYKNELKIDDRDVIKEALINQVKIYSNESAIKDLLRKGIINKYN